MSLLLSTLLALAPAPHEIPREQVIVREASLLVVPCREAAQAYFKAQDVTTYQWSASHKSRGNTLFVDGRLRLEDGKDVRVSCWIARGARLGSMTLEIRA
ncbi:hypothetical protein GCM10011521_16450 [Arenimonas soli]|uniref:Uncharacterized protein n=1 Tax=Arenimonas soli TaxID=2269504 RepID=A0ABQ1HI59_9GAMM|nr:hypothetical protein [Arenimonas soli]GGA78949.1 hypothetical protein GCM10011521_16450 [Arenimonas soli]